MHRVVVVGCGAMSHVWFEAAAARKDVEIVGLVDLDLARAKDCRSRHGLGTAVIGTDLEAVLAESRAEVVFDIAVPAARAAIVRTAFAHGCDVLSEKPMAETLEEARELVSLARRLGRRHVIIQNRRYLATVRRIARFLRSGALGPVTSLHCDFFLAPHFGGFREAMDHVLLLDMAVHTFDAARLMTGEDAVQVYAEEWNPPESWYRQGACALALFRLASGARFSYRGSWCARGLGTSWEASWRIVGTRGTLLWDGGEVLEAEIADPDPAHRDGLFEPVTRIAVPELSPEDRIGGHAGVMADFFAARAGNQPAETEGAANLGTLAMVHGAIASARAGRPVDIQS